MHTPRMQKGLISKLLRNRGQNSQHSGESQEIKIRSTSDKGRLATSRTKNLCRKQTEGDSTAQRFLRPTH